MKTILLVIGVIVVILMFSTLMGGIKTAQTDERTDTFAAVTTGGGIVEADVVLVADIYGNDILNVVSITSDLNTDAPLPDTYVAGTNILTVRGLTASQTRTLTVVYQYSALTGDAESAGTFLGFTPLLIGISIVVIIIAGLVMAFKNR